MGVTSWHDMPNPEDNWLWLPGGNEDRGIADEDWMLDCVRGGSLRAGSWTNQEVLGGPWGTAARDCAIAHAINGDNNPTPYLWDDVCPDLATGLADPAFTGTPGVTYVYTDPATPTGITIITATVRAFGIWLVPLKLNLPPRGVLSLGTLDPIADGVPPEFADVADIEFQSPYVSLAGVWVASADNAGDPDPDARYAVNYNKQPSFIAGEWQGFRYGSLPGAPLDTVPAWVDGPEDYSLTFPSEPAVWTDKTLYQLDIPADGFESLTQDYVNDTYDYGVAAGPAEVFGERTLSASRSVSTSLIVKALVVSPPYRWVWTDDVIPPRQIWGRPGDEAMGAARVYGGAGTVQTGTVYGGIL